MPENERSPYPPLAALSFVGMRAFIALTLAGVLFLSACGAVTPVSPAPATVTSLPAASQTSPPAPTAVIAPTLMPSPVPSISSPAAKFVNYKCAEKVEAFSAKVNSSGVILLKDPHPLNNSAELLDMAGQKINYLPNDSGNLHAGPNFFISPNRKWFAYTRIEDGNVISQDVVIMKADGKINKIIPIPFNREIFSWLDDENLQFSVFEPDQVVKIMLLNPFTKKQKSLADDFPDRYTLRPWPWSTEFVYSPDQNYVVYPSITDREYVILYDLKHGKIKAKVPIRIWNLSPKWSQDGNFVSIMNFRPISLSAEQGIYLAGKDGLVNKLSPNFGTPFIFGSYEWSPDSRKIAFWMNTQPHNPKAGYPNSDNYRQHYELALLDTVTGQITSFCTTGIEYFDLGPALSPSAPIWSPDGDQLAFMKYDENDKTKFAVFILDLKTNSFEKIAENMEPVGWMSAEP